MPDPHTTNSIVRQIVEQVYIQHTTSNTNSWCRSRRDWTLYTDTDSLDTTPIVGQTGTVGRIWDGRVPVTIDPGEWGKTTPQNPKKTQPAIKSTKNYKPWLSNQPKTEQIPSTSSTTSHCQNLSESTQDSLNKDQPLLNLVTVWESCTLVFTTQIQVFSSRDPSITWCHSSNHVHKVLSFTIQWASSSKYLVTTNSATAWLNTHFSSHDTSTRPPHVLNKCT